ncbi:YcxB family protein [Aliiglaciecola sp. CAU 1673]|uniref:YcxB family protein n=1 Tax=Aliiglaciecola sp. CAU 1673 TaxID=3032595 RepID=UPI0031F3B4D0
MSFSYSTTYVLDKGHFSETYDESNTPKPARQAYLKGIVLAALGIAILSLMENSGYLGGFIIALAGVEALSVRFHKAWWLARQMISRAANNELTLSIDESAVTVKSAYVDSKLAWSEITKFEKTAQGWLLYHGKGKYYLSDRCLSNDAQLFLQGKAGE